LQQIGTVDANTEREAIETAAKTFALRLKGMATRVPTRGD
jgi:hypothetical protein